MVAKARVRIEGEDATAAAWNSVLGRAKKSANMVAGVWRTALAGISVSTVTSLVRSQIELGDTLAKGAQKAGMSGKEFTAYAHAAKMADVEVTGLSTAIKFMQINLSKATKGGKEQLEVLGDLGLSIEQIQDLNPGAQFELLAERISILTSEEDRARILTELFGKAGSDLGPMFENGAEGIRQAREEAERLGVVFDDDQLKRVADADDAIKRLDASWQAFATTLTAEVAPSLTKILDRMSSGQTLEDLKKIAASPVFGAIALAEDIFGDEPEEEARRKVPGRRGGGRSQGRMPPMPKKRRTAAEIRAAEKAEQERVSNAVEAQERRAQAALEEQQRVADMNRTLDEHADKLTENVEDYFKGVGESLEDLEIEVTDQVEFFTEVWGEGFDAWQQNGKHTTRELAKYMALELGERAIDYVLNQWGQALGGMAPAGGGSSFLSALFGGSFAEGGDAQPNRLIEVGERGRELIWTGGRGMTVIPNHALGGNTIAPVINVRIDARGATTETIKLLPAMGRQIAMEVETRVVRNLKRGNYGDLSR